MSSTDSSASASTTSASSTEANAVVTTNAAAQTQPADTGRPTPPDMVAGDSVHRPGMAPGMAILDGPATMRVGAHRESKSGKGKGGSKR